MTSPYSWFQYFLNVSDETALNYLRIFTFLDREELAGIEQETVEKPHLRAAQRRLAESLTTLVHGEKETQQVTAASQALFAGASCGAGAGHASGGVRGDSDRPGAPRGRPHHR